MIKLLSIVISALAVLLVSLFGSPQAGIQVTSTVSSPLIPGKDCIVKITLNKGGVSGYAQLQHVLPLGWLATSLESMGAKFGLKDNIVTFAWDELPGENSITVSYRLQTDPNQTGTAQITGAFFYTEENQTVKVDVTLVTLDFSSSAVAHDDAGVKRKIIAVTPESGEYKVELTFHKKSGEHTARFIDQIPDGFTVTNINSNGAKFMFSNQQATFLWSELPNENIFKISYILEAKSEEFENPKVTGMLVYGSEGDAPKSMASAAAETPAEATLQPESEIPAQQIAANLLAEENSKVAIQQRTTYVPVPEEGIFFKIQIAATRKSPLRNDKFFEEKYHLSQHVDLTEQDGWRKYMLGHFDTYASADEFNKRTKAVIPDAFVVAYRNTIRIPLREALSEMPKAN